MRFAAIATVLMLVFAPAHAQQIKLSDATYTSASAYLDGIWKWERPEPRQTVIMRFNRDGTFFFHNLTIDLQHWGTYRATDNSFSVSLTRSCEKQGSDCANRTPPKTFDYPFTPTSANVFMSKTERWERMK